MNATPLDILVFAAHPDDAELSCAGTIMKEIASGKKVGIVDLTRGELGTRGTAETRKTESAAASAIMGVVVRENLEMADGFFKNDEEHQRKIIQTIRKYKPAIVLCNALSDRHPDHGRAAQLVADSCFLSGLIKIDTGQEVWKPRAVYHYIQDRTLKPDFLIDISAFMDRKMQAIRAYKTQFYDADSQEPSTYISNPDFLNILVGRCAEWGKQIGVAYAEGFNSQKLIGIENLNSLL